MGLQFYIGGSGSGKSFRLYQDVIGMSVKNPKTQYLIIVPDQFTMQTQKEVVCMHPNKGIMNIDVLSFGRLSHRIFEETGGNDKVILDDTGKSLVLRRVAGEMEDSLDAIGGNLRKIGYIHEVKSSISEFMQYGIGLKELDELICSSESRSGLQCKLKDLKKLYEGFINYMKDRLITTEESLTILKNVLERSELIRNSVVVFDGFTGFTPVQNGLIQRIMELAKEVIVTVVIDGDEDPYHIDGEQKLFFLCKKTVVTLERLALESKIPRRNDVILKGEPVWRFENQPALAHLERGLFRFGMKAYDQEQDSISVYESANPCEEVRFVCSRILKLIREDNYRYQDFAVVTGDLPEYAHFIKQQFHTFGIPCFLDRTRGIILNPFIEYIRSAITVIRQNFTYETVFHFLRSGLIPIGYERLDKLENYVLAMGIKGIKRWSELWTRYEEDPDQDGQEELANLNRDRERIVEMLAPLLLKKKTAGELACQVYDFISDAGIQTRLFEYERYFEETGDFAAAKEYGQIYRLVMELLEQIVELLGTEEMDLKEFSQILDAGFSEIQVGSIPLSADQVVIGDIERTRLKKIKVLFFIGINDGIIPKSRGAGGLLSDIDREFLSGLDYELAPTPRQQMYIQKLYLYMNMTKPAQRLFLSYSQIDGEGRSLRPAYLIAAVCQLFTKLKIKRNEQADNKIADSIAVPEEGINCLAQELRYYASGVVKEQDELDIAALYNWYQKSPVYSKTAEALMTAAFYRYTDNPISKAAASALYGKTLHNSVSRLEKYAACAFAYFLQYGLALRERDLFGFESVDMGNVFHGVLEKFSIRLEESAYSWLDFPVGEGERMVSEALEEYAVNYGETILYSSARNEYIIEKMRRILNKTVLTLQYQLKKGMFEPSSAELPFSIKENLDESEMQIHGRIDRVDLCEEGGNIYVKVVDYKSGSKTFDVTGLYYGLQMQLMVYLNAAVELTSKLRPGKNVIPAAVLYYHVSDPFVEREREQMSSEEIVQRQREKLNTTGVINSDQEITAKLDTTISSKSDVIPVGYKKDGSYTAVSSVMNSEELGLLSEYTRFKMRELGSAVLGGYIGVNPYELGTQSSCTYCNYKGICGYDKRIPGFEMRSMDIKKEEALEKIRQCMKTGLQQGADGDGD